MFSGGNMEKKVSKEYPQWFIDELAYEEDKQKVKDGLIICNDFLTFKCTIHGEYRQRVSNHIRLRKQERVQGCPVCANIKRKETLKHTMSAKRESFPQSFIDELVHEEDKQRAIDKTMTYKDCVELKCPIHGVYTQRVYDHIENKQGCPKCGKDRFKQWKIDKNIKDRKEYPKWFIDELAYEEDKQKAKDRKFSWSAHVDFLCPIHGVYSQRIDAHMNTKTMEKKQGCPKCGSIKQKESRKKTLIEHRKEYPQWFIDELAHEEDKNRAKNKTLLTGDIVDFICPIHGVYSQYVHNHINTSTGTPLCGCPACGNRASMYEKEIYEYVNTFCKDALERDRSTVKSETTNRYMELDVYIPEKRIGIEYNGSFWHREDGKGRDYHLNKYLLCEKNNIRLISIFDKDWMENKEKIKSFLHNILSPKILVYGRNTEIKVISKEEANNLYDTYHLKGGDSSISVSYGLFYKADLISAMSFSRPKFGSQKDMEWDISRYCVRYGYSVIGGAEKLFKAFLKEYTPQSIISYSDNDYFSGDVYKKLGFVFDKITDLPYYWAKDNVFYSRQKCQVKILKEKYPDIYNKALEDNASNKEEYIMHALGFYKVYRCGNKKWVWKA